MDRLRALCATMVVFLHSTIVGKEFIVPVTRCAVPCFLIISGYLLYSPDRETRMARYAKAMRHILFIIIWSSALFACVTLLFAIKNQDYSILSLKVLKDFLLFNENPFGFHLWYLSAYLYAVVAIWLADRFKVLRILAIITPPMLLIDLLLGKYSLVAFGHEYPFLYVRNFLFVGIPYTAIGMMMRRMNIHRLKGNHAAIACCLSCTLFFSITTLLERYILVSMDCNATRDHYASTTFLAVSLFLLFMVLPSLKADKISAIGRRDSLYIYILHPLFLIAYTTLRKRIPEGMLTVYSYIAPFLILLLTLLLISMSRRVYAAIISLR